MVKNKLDDVYPWPCARRDAHGPHARLSSDQHKMTFEQVMEKVRSGDTYRVCPGVPAHPDTMIGKSKVQSPCEGCRIDRILKEDPEFHPVQNPGHTCRGVMKA